MTLTIELTPEEERRLRSAQAKGIDVTAIFKGILTGLSEDTAPLYETATPEEWDQRFTEWVESHDHMPTLPPESYERAAFYGERG
jgi:hypothetical protein